MQTDLYLPVFVFVSFISPSLSLSLSLSLPISLCFVHMSCIDFMDQGLRLELFRVSGSEGLGFRVQFNNDALP